jgi:hypothetical protein
VEIKKDKLKANLEPAMIMAIGELIIAVAIVLVYLLIGKYDYTVLLGAILGAVVMIGNMLFLSISVNRAVNKYLELRGDKEMSDEEAEEFNKKYALGVQNAMNISYIVRTLTLIAALVLAFALAGGKVFSPLPTAITLLMYRPIIYVGELIRTRLAGKGDR